MWKKFTMHYLTLSKKDRYAIAILLALYILVTVMPGIFPSRSTVAEIDHENLISEVNSAFNDSASPESYSQQTTMVAESEPPARVALFHFDPNTATMEQWSQLGVPTKTASTIKNYIAKGGKFRKPEDLLKIYTIDKNLASRLIPYIRIPESRPSDPPVADKTIYTSEKLEKLSYPTKRYSVINISTADTTILKTLPGIGSRLAIRIVTYRERLGGFITADQVAEVKFLHDSVYQKIRPFLIVDESVIERRNLNTSTIEVLSTHPYIGFALANAIIKYREQHGNFKKVSDLMSLHSISPEKYEQIKPYLSVEE